MRRTVSLWVGGGCPAALWAWEIADDALPQGGDRGVLGGDGGEVQGDGVGLGGECAELVAMAPQFERSEVGRVGALGRLGLGAGDVLGGRGP